MRKSVYFKLVTFACLTCLSCASNKNLPQANTQGKTFSEEETSGEEEIVWEKASSLDELEGLWTFSDLEDVKKEIIFEYPFSTGGKKYMRLALSESDDTDLWLEKAMQTGLSFEELWSKRFAYLNIIYKNAFPYSDPNGTQTGLKIRMIGGHVYSRTEYLIPESVLILNMKFFYLAQDKKSFREEGFFRFASSKIEDFAGKQRIFTKNFQTKESDVPYSDVLDSAIFF